MNKLLVVAGISTILVVAAVAAIALNTPSEPESLTFPDSNSTQTTSPNDSSTPSDGSSSSTSTGSEDTSPDTSNPDDAASDTKEPEDDHSAIATFDVSMKLFETEHVIIHHPDEVLYSCYGYISWEPSTYVRYYEVTPNFNGNNMPYENRYCGSDYMLWGTQGHELRPFPWTENETLIVGPQSVAHMFPKTYKGPYNMSGTWVDTDEDGSRVYGPTIWPDTQHGLKVITITSVLNREDRQQNLSPEQIAQIKAEMSQLLADFVRGWTFTIKSVV